MDISQEAGVTAAPVNEAVGQLAPIAGAASVQKPGVDPAAAFRAKGEAMFDQLVASVVSEATSDQAPAATDVPSQSVEDRAKELGTAPGPTPVAKAEQKSVLSEIKLKILELSESPDPKDRARAKKMLSDIMEEDASTSATPPGPEPPKAPEYAPIPERHTIREKVRESIVKRLEEHYSKPRITNVVDPDTGESVERVVKQKFDPNMNPDHELLLDRELDAAVDREISRIHAKNAKLREDHDAELARFTEERQYQEIAQRTQADFKARIDRVFTAGYPMQDPATGARLAETTADLFPKGADGKPDAAWTSHFQEYAFALAHVESFQDEVRAEAKNRQIDPNNLTELNRIAAFKILQRFRAIMPKPAPKQVSNPAASAANGATHTNGAAAPKQPATGQFPAHLAAPVTMPRDGSAAPGAAPTARAEQPSIGFKEMRGATKEQIDEMLTSRLSAALQ